MTRHRLRVGAAQFATTQDVDENLVSCLRAIDGAAAQDADLVVLPEFANHISVYESADHCRDVAVDLDGSFLAACAARARRHAIHVVVTVTLRRGDAVTVTNVMLGPDGRVLGTSDKQTLMGNERAYLSGGDATGPVVQTTFGPIGMYSCMDGVTCEVPRGLAVAGARLLTNSLNSFALDEAALHIPVRAAENGVYVVAANKVGPLLPADRVEAFAEALGVPAMMLDGAGESQIVAPDGTVLARAPRVGEAMVVAEVDLSLADHRPHAGRRPELYSPLAVAATEHPAASVPTSVTAAALADLGAVKRAAVADVVVMPELTAAPDELTAVPLLVSTVRDGDAHVGVLRLDGEIVGEQLQLHHTSRHPWATRLCDGLSCFDTPFGRIAILVGDDVLHPETARLAAIAGCHLLAVSHEPVADWQSELALVERAAENRLCLIAAAPEGPHDGTALMSPPADSLWSPERVIAYDGTINTPDVIRSVDGIALGTVHPRRALDREVSRDTNLVDGRPWKGSGILVEQDLNSRPH